ncbi:MAG: Gfo/Idh/MocA family oxidoreductase [Actinomycetota bacterium]
MAAPVRLAVVGAGRMGAFHARTLSRMDGISVVAVVDQRIDQANRVATEAAAAALDSVEHLQDLYHPDGWLIATPTPTHPAIVAKALENGAHVLCEKPLALDVQAGAALGAKAAALGRILQVGFWRRFSPPWRHAKAVVERGTIGRPVLVRLSQWDADPPPPEFCDPAVSGGLAIDCGVHEYDLAEWLTGCRVERVLARNLAIVDEALGAVGDVDNLAALIDLTGGAAAAVDLSRNGRYGDDVRTEILGSEGAIFIDSLPTGRARLATRDGIEVVAGSEVEDVTVAGIAGQALAFASAVGGGPTEIPGAEASNRAVSIGLAVQRSAISGRWVEV